MRTSENNRRAKYYTLTAQGKKQMAVETSKWERWRERSRPILKPAKSRRTPKGEAGTMLWIRTLYYKLGLRAADAIR